MKPSEATGALETGGVSFLAALIVDRYASKSPSRGTAQTYRTRVPTGVDVDNGDKLVDRIKAVCGWGGGICPKHFFGRHFLSQGSSLKMCRSSEPMKRSIRLLQPVLRRETEEGSQ